MIASRFGGAIAGLICIAAGAYLLQTQSTDGNSWFEAIAHGMGIYFIGKGIFVWVTTSAQIETVRALRSTGAMRRMPSTEEQPASVIPG